MYQVSDHTRSQFEKMLGLASVKGLMEKMGGSVSASVHEGCLVVALYFQ